MMELNISERISKIQKSAIHEMTRLAAEVDDPAFLSWAKPTSDTPEHIKQAAIKAIEKGYTGGYSQNTGLPQLREAIAEKLNSFNKIKALPNQIMVTVGAIEGLAAAVMATVDPGDEVILPIPTYSTHIRQVVLASAKPVMVPVKVNNDFELDIEAIEKAVTPRTKAIMYCSPANPTGAVFAKETLERLAEIALKNNLYVITDEAYEYFTFDGAKHFSIGAIPEMKENTISCFTFTKTYAMTGWRIGYLHASEKLIPHLSKVHIPLAICAPVVSQYAALAALTGSQQCVTEFYNHYLSARNHLCSRLDKLDTVFEYYKPKGSYLMFPKIKLEEGSDSIAFCKKMLNEARVSATPGIAFGPNGEGHLRLSFCVSKSEIDKAFDRLEQYFHSA
jgi:aminotransferase